MNTNTVVVLGVAGVAVLYLVVSAKKKAATVAPNHFVSPASPPSGGTLSSLGAWFNVAQQVVGSYDPNSISLDRQTPPGQFATVSNPVQASPAVLPYSYKQATVDVPSLLGTDQLFTPGDGSSGSYSESDSGTTTAWA